jgi:rRNA maturation RNase YbeY
VPISFHNADVKFVLKHKSELKKFISKEFSVIAGKRISVSYVFCSDEFLLNINKQFLNHDYYTDIITFPMNVTDFGVDAEIYVSITRVNENALKLKSTFEDELLRVMFHGILHLVGYKDKTTTQKREMRLKEDEWVTAFKRFRTNTVL